MISRSPIVKRAADITIFFVLLIVASKFGSNPCPTSSDRPFGVHFHYFHLDAVEARANRAHNTQHKTKIALLSLQVNSISPGTKINNKRIMAPTWVIDDIDPALSVSDSGRATCRGSCRSGHGFMGGRGGGGRGDGGQGEGGQGSVCSRSLESIRKGPGYGAMDPLAVVLPVEVPP